MESYFLVAAGKLDGVIAFRPKNDWDIAAGDLLVQEGGGIMTDIVGTPHKYNQNNILHENLIASGAAIHPVLLGRVKTGAPKSNRV